MPASPEGDKQRGSRPLVIFVVAVLLTVAVVAVASQSQSPVVASRLNYNVHLFLNGVSTDGWTVDTCPRTESNGTGPWLCSIASNGVVENNSLTFLTGQRVQVNLWFEYLKKPSDPSTITLESVAAGRGFQVSEIEQAVPFTMSGWGDQAGVVVVLDVLPGLHSGSVDMYVRFSG